jgi:hypothetical protein
LHCCFACADGTATGENAATTQATNATELICFVILKGYSLLQSTYGDNQIGPFENFHQFGENALVVLGSRFEVFLQYALGFVDGLKNQPLIGHAFLPIQFRLIRRKREIKSIFGIIPSTFVSRRSLSGRKCQEHLGPGGREPHIGPALMPRQPAKLHRAG